MKKTKKELENENAVLKKQLAAFSHSAIQQFLELEEIITNTSTRFVHLEKERFDDEVNHALAEITLQTGIDRAYVFLYDLDKKQMSNTHECCAPGISEEKDNLQNLPISLFPWWHKKLVKNEVINFYSIQDLPPEAVVEKEILEAQSILSVLVVPVTYSGEVLGFMGFDFVRTYKKWTDREIRILRLLSEIFGNALHNFEIEKKLTDNLEKYRLLVENSGAAILISNAEGEFQFANAIAAKNFGLAPHQMNGKNMYDFFTKEQADIFVSNINKTLRLREKTEQESLFKIGNQFLWHKSIIEPLEESGQGNRVMILSFNIHEEKNKKLEIEKLNTRLKVLNQIDRAIISQFNSKDDFYLTALIHLYSLIPCNIIGFATFNEKEQVAETKALLIEGKAEDGNQFKVKYEDLNFEIIKDEGSFVEEIKKDSFQSNFQKYLYKTDIRSYLVLPVFYNNQPVGALVLLSNKSHYFISEHLEIVNEIDQQLIIGYRQILLNEQIKHQNEYLEEIVEIRTKEIETVTKLNSSIVDTTGSLVFSASKEGIIQTMNPVAEKVLGYTKNEVVNKMKITDFYSSAALKQLQQKIEEEYHLKFEKKSEILPYIAKNITAPVELTLTAKNGSILPMLISINSISDKNGEITGYAGIAVDIRKRVEAEHALRLQQAAFENFVHAMLISDVNGKLIWCNSAYKKLSGYSFEELKKAKVGTLQKSGIHSAEFYQNLWQTLLKGEVWRGEIINKRKDGSLYPEDLTISPVKNARGEIINFVAIKINITDKKKAEQNLKESNQIKQGLLDTFPDLLFHLDKEGTYKDVYTLDDNKLFLPRDQFIGKKIEEVLPPDLAKESMKNLRKALSAKSTVIYNYSLVIQHVKHFFENRIVAISEDEVLSVIRDITDLKLTEYYSGQQLDLGFKLASAIQPADAIEHVITFVMKPEEINAVGFFLHDSGKDEYNLFDYKGFSGNFVEEFRKIKPPFSAGNLLRERNLMVRPSNKTLSEIKNLELEEFFQVGYIPVVHDQNLIGLLMFASIVKKKLNRIILSHIEMIAGQMAGALNRIYAQQQLISSRENFRLLFETIDDFLFIVNTKGNLVEYNKVVERRLDYSKSELYGMHVLEFHPPDKREEANRIVKEILAGQTDFCQLPLVTKNGDQIPVETKVVNGKWNGNNVLYAVSRDISQRLKYEEKLRESEARWQVALENSGDGIWDWDVKSGSVFFSRQWKKMLGYREHDISNSLDEWKSRVHPEDMKQVMKNLDLHFKGKVKLYKDEYRVLCKNGEYKWILDRGKVVSWDKNGNPARMIGIYMDISKRKKTENSLAMALERERELNELKSQFVSMASHEFRTPLATMLMATETLEAYWERMTPEERKQKIERLKNNIVFLRNIIEKTMNLSMIDSGKMNFSPVETNLNILVEKAIERVNDLFSYNHQVIFNPLNSNAEIIIDKQMIDEAFSNLLTNSFKYSEAGTTIEVILGKKKKCFTIEVTDKGIGIPESEQKNLFNAFWRGTNVGTIHGTGLGLPLSKKFVELHNGNITFQSRINAGTTFIISLPEKPYKNK
jgi:PAS domain S-box-containing protein